MSAWSYEDCDVRIAQDDALSGSIGTQPSDPERVHPKTRTRRTLQWAIAALFGLAACCLIVVAVAVTSGAWQIRPVLSGSMRPDLPVGGVVVTQRVPLDSLAVGDVAVFHPPVDPRLDYVHRIIWLRRRAGELLVRTKGDANATADPWLLHVRGRWGYVARFSVPWIGYAAVWVHSPPVRHAAVIGAGVLASVLVASVLIDRRRRSRAPAPTGVQA